MSPSSLVSWPHSAVGNHRTTYQAQYRTPTDMSAACTQFHEAVEGQAGARLYQEEPARSKANQKETEGMRNQSVVLERPSGCIKAGWVNAWTYFAGIVFAQMTGPCFQFSSYELCQMWNQWLFGHPLFDHDLNRNIWLSFSLSRKDCTIVQFMPIPFREATLYQIGCFLYSFICAIMYNVICTIILQIFLKNC